MSYLWEAGKTALGVSSFVGAWSLLVSWGGLDTHSIFTFKCIPPFFFFFWSRQSSSGVTGVCAYLCECVTPT